MSAFAGGSVTRTPTAPPQVGGPSLPPTRRLGDLLLEARLATTAQIESALAAQSTRRRRLGEILREDGVIDDTTLAAVLSVQLDAPLVDLREHPSDEDALRAIAEADARRLTILPLALRDTRLFVATEDPGDRASLEEAARLSGRRIEPLLAFRSEIQDAIPRRYRVTGDLAVQVSAFASRKPELPTPATVRERDAALIDLSAAPVVQIVNLLVTQALRDRASDLHLEPQMRGLRVRARVDGILRDVAELPADLAPGLVSRIKILAELNIVEKQRAQDGQITLDIEGRPVDIRVATMRTMWGEKVVLRLLDRARTFRRLDQLGFPPTVHPAFRSMLDSTFGMIVVAGPTGSGKTTTLYASINETDRTALNVTTIEDPIEYTFENVNQTQVNTAAGITFATGLRAILRQDPDVILVGEMRDRETTEIAVQAALTGHLVLSSMHATDAASGLLRVLEMGVEPFLVAASVTGIAAQRLMRRICVHCRLEIEPTVEEHGLFLNAGIAVPNALQVGRGCTYCGGTGFLDRIATYELLRVTPELRRLISRGVGYDELRAQAITDGMIPLRTDALRKAAAGITTTAEALRCVVAA
jgi:type IV pilus assembly protein PilB